MVTYDNMLNRQRKWMLYLLVVLVLGASFTPYPTIFLGLLLGCSISFYNQILLHKKIGIMGEKIVREEKPKGLGMFARLAAVAFGVIIALRFTEHINIIALIIGFMASYLIIVIDFVLNIRDSSERGEKGG